MSMLCIGELDLKLFQFLTTNIVIKKIYKLGTVCMSTFINPPLQGFLGATPSMIHIIIISSSSSSGSITLCMIVDEPQKILS